MIPAAFDYVAPDSLEDALERLAAEGDEAKILAGGHSLLPLMKLRLAYPTLLIDLGRISSLRFIKESDGRLEFGAMTPYADIERSPLVREKAPMLAQTAGLVGDAQVRHRGTIGGALAHADPAGDMPAVVSALGGTVTIASVGGRRQAEVSSFFTGIFETGLAENEVITGVQIPISSKPVQHYEKFRRRLCDWAIVGSSAALELDDGHIRSARVFLTNVGPTPMRAESVEKALAGSATDEASLAAASESAAEGLEPTPELNGSAEYKKHLARVITKRALIAAVHQGAST